MKKRVSKQAKRASKLAKAENLRKKEQERVSKILTVKNAEGDPDTVAEILIKNKIDYTPKVSVVMPVYNVEPYLRQCLDSVLNQTLKEIEIICVDDGSTDASLDILKEYAEKDKRITVITQKNLYAGVARNAGLSQAKGEYLSFLDSDDFFELNMLEEMSKKADEDDSDIVICGNYVYDEQKQEIMRQVHIGKQFVDASPFVPENFADCLFNCCNPNPWNKLFKHNIFEEYKIFYEKFVRVNDMTCVCSAISKARKISVIDKPFITYRFNQKNNATADRGKKADCFLYAIAKLESNLKRINTYNKFKNAFVKRVINSFKWEMSVCNREQQEIIKDEACKILSKELYNQIFDIKVSVIIPVYNVEKYLRECLDSVINQTLYSIEIICVDDGSTDASLEILKEYANKDFRIKIYQQNHKRAGAARNLGVRMAHGKYIYFIDSDDWIDLDGLEKLYNKIEKEQSDICIYGIKNHDEKTHQAYEDSYRNMSCFKNRPQEICTFQDIKDQIFKRFGAFYNIYSKKFFIKNNLFFQEDILIGEDVLTHVKSLILAKKISFLDENLYYYRVNREGSSMASSKNDKTILDVFNYVDKVEKFLIESQTYQFLENQYIDFVFEQFSFHFRRMITDQYKQEFIEKTKKYIKNLDNIKIRNSKCAQSFQQEIKISKKISLIIPVYNVEKYLRECLDSAINQTLRNIEIICINDGSSDHSLEILKEYAANDKRLKIIDQKNQGLSCSRNNAMKIAKGEFIVFLDSDDYLRKDALNLIYNTMKAQQLDMFSYSGVNFENKTKEIYNDRYWEFVYLNKNIISNRFSYNERKSFMHKMAVSSCLTAYRLNFIKSNNIYFPAGLCFEDNLFFTEAITQAKYWGYTREKLYFRRIHDASITQNWDKHFSDYLKITDLVLSYIKKKDRSLLDNYRKYLTSCCDKFDAFDKKTQKKYTKELNKLLSKYRKKVPLKLLLKSYLRFPYNQAKIKKLIVNYLEKFLSTYRIDIKNFGNEYNALEIIANNNTSVTEPKWFSNNDGIGKLIQGSEMSNIISLKALNEGIFKIDFRGQDKRYDGKRYPLWIDYKSIKIDGKEILSAPIATWHDKPFHYELPVKDGQEIILEIEQQYHEYTENELKDILLKLNLKSDYLTRNISRLIKELKKSLPIIDEKIKRKNKLEKYTTDIVTSLTTCRIDIKNIGTKNNALEITANNMSVSEPKWFTNEQGIGKVLQSNSMNNIIRLKAINGGRLKFDFHGSDKRCDGNRIPLWIDYKSIKIDGKEILSAPIATWHDKPYYYEMPIKNGQEITVEVEQQYHEYTENELKDIVLKLNLNSDYVSQNIDRIIEELKKKLPIIKKRNYFDIQKEFFVIDTNNLDLVKTHLYGYIIQENGIIENENLKTLESENISGCGAYIYVERLNEQILIKQDFTGSYGLFLFKKDKYFAISNSFFYLLDYVKSKFQIENNTDYFNYMLIQELCSEAYSDTPIKNIKILDKDAIIKINIPTREMLIESIDYKINQYSIESAKGMEILDSWFEKWTTLFRYIKEKTSNLSISLSGGIDSRLTLLLVLKSGINLKDIAVGSLNDNLHTHAEDYQIASEIAKYFGFELNEGHCITDTIAFSLEDIINICIYNRLPFHKEMQYKYRKNKYKCYNIPGNGGECIRAHWDFSPQEQSARYIAKTRRYNEEVSKIIAKSVLNIAENSYQNIKEKYHIQDISSEDILRYLYINTRCRHHFGRGAVNDYFSNNYVLPPLLDPLLLSLKINTKNCPDNNLLISVIFTRYCPELLNFKIEGNRCIDIKTIDYAKKINERFPFNRMLQKHRKDKEIIYNIDTVDYNIINKTNINSFVASDLPDHFFETICNSDVFKNIICKIFNQNIYDVAKQCAEKSSWYPLRELYPLINVLLILRDIKTNKNSNLTNYDYLEHLKNNSLKKEEEKMAA